MKKKVTAWMLCLAMLFGIMPGIAIAEDEIHISTVEQLSAINTDSTSLAGNYVLDNNIDLTGYSWTAIGPSNSASFTGTFDGNGYSITGLEGAQGVFSIVNGGTVKNLRVEGNISGRDGIGLIAGVLQGAGRILNCYAEGSVSGGNYVGGLVQE